jgi:serine/threonine protein kinase
MAKRTLVGPVLSRSEFSYDEKDLLGAGSYSCVYKGLCRGTIVAVKKNTNPLDKKVLTDLQAEISALRDNPHPNIVQCMGVCIEADDVFLVTEYCGGGTLDELLHERTGLYIPLYRRMDLASQIAKGLAWIHGTGYIHRDLKPANVFITDERFTSCKIGDFGFALKGEPKRDGKGSGLWMAPEKMLRIHETPKSDVYSFAILLWECLTREDPFLEYEEMTEFVEAVCEEHVRPAIPLSTPYTLHSLLVSAWADDPADRPNSADLPAAFPEILIDVSIEDPKGQEFWKKAFKNEFTVPYESLVNKLFAHCGYQAPVSDPMREYIYTAIPHGEEGTTQAHEFGSFLKWFGPLTTDKAILTRIKSVFERDWFWPDLSTEDAQSYLQSQPDGTFLIRFSSQPQNHGSYTLSRVRGGKVAHRRIMYLPNRMIFSDPSGKLFPTLDAVIQDANLGEPLQELGKISRFRRQKAEAPAYEDAASVRQYLSQKK